MGDWRISGQPLGAMPKVGAVYEIDDQRQGLFQGRVRSVAGSWAHVEKLRQGRPCDELTITAARCRLTG